MITCTSQAGDLVDRVIPSRSGRGRSSLAVRLGLFAKDTSSTSVLVYLSTRSGMPSGTIRGCGSVPDPDAQLTGDMMGTMSDNEHCAPERARERMDDERVDRRVRRTRELLHGALISLILEKGYERVTVRDIIDRADIGRSTFYAHFRDKEDLLLAGFEEVRRLFEPPGSSASSTTTGPARAYLEPSARLFEHFSEYRTVWRAMAGKQGGTLVRRHLHELLSGIVRDQLQPRAPSGQQTQVPLGVVVEFTVGALLGLGIWWLDEDKPYSPEEMDIFFTQLTEPGIRSGLRPTPGFPAR
jgi:AcrR family transcriptional regulator